MKILPPVLDVEIPPERCTAPPFLELLVPEDISTSPDLPPEAAPVIITTRPDAPLVADPEENIIDPLIPFTPAFDDCSVILPLLDLLLEPENTTTAPPVVVDDIPARNDIFEPRLPAFPSPD
jgi:hypothetical protein